MPYLLLSILFNSFIGHFLKLGERLKVSVFFLLLINYLSASIISWGRAGSFVITGPVLPFYCLAFYLGAQFVICYFLLQKVISRIGVSLSVSISRISAVIPTIGSILIFSEMPRILQIPGIIIAIASLPLSGAEVPRKENIMALLHGSLGWGLLLFAAFGMNDFTFKFFAEFYSGTEPEFFMAVVFTTALAITAVIVLVRRIRFSLKGVFLGLGLGLVNFGATIFFMLALDHIQGFKVYPLNGVGIIFVSAVTGILLWGEKIKGHNWIFLGMAAASVMLIY